MTTRFAPSTTGHAHPGTLLAGLLCWLDARSRDDRVLLRFENLDPVRCKAAYLEAMRADLEWFGLDWDGIVIQSDLRPQHEAALDALAARGLLYPCECTRSQRRRSGRRAPDGGYAYDNTCRGRPLPPGGWRQADQPLRAQLPDQPIVLVDESGLDLSQHPSRDMGDPIVMRRDGAMAYHLAVVVDDAASGVDRVVRGRDLATSTATQVALQRLLGVPTPSYRHHALFLEPHGGKLAKFHGSVAAAELRQHYSAAELCGCIAWAAGLQDQPAPRSPRDLVASFAWQRVMEQDRVLVWRDNLLHLESA
jgi:glutamyl/glutaminyl-tRNA synthetase